MALKGLVHKVFGPPPGAVPKGPKPGLPEAAMEEIKPPPASDDLGPLERAQAPVVEVDEGKLEEVAARLRTDASEEAEPVDEIETPSGEEVPAAAEDNLETVAAAAPVEIEDSVPEVAAPEAELPEIVTEEATAVSEDEGEDPAAVLEAAEAEEEAALEIEDAVVEDAEGESGGEGDGDGEEKEEGDLFNSLFAGMGEEEEDDFLSRLIATIPEISAQDLLDQAEDLKSLMQDLEQR